ncbi:phage major tail tube protein [Pseudomonas nitroreducens]|uniref:Phage major tail tube protein n=1 Tax=Pseudomonas nitroreducens TaxID=46680 RepID=A0A6G6IUZ7_PSENT|nr:phage major tail tube protein [Pseudomonas nitroreducens]QIE87026.1 phage major tail tube protein [Pseudomonas nitroreducens]
MAMPRKLKNMNLFNDANSFLGVSKSVTPPKLARKMESFRAAGMNGPVEADLGFSDDGLVIEFTQGGLDVITIKQFAAATVTAVPLRWAGAYQQDDSGEVTAVEIVVRGRVKEIDMGDAKPGEDTEHKFTVTCSYYKLTVGGEEVVEIDLLNFIEKVDGKDMLAEQRKAIGI